MDGDPGDQVEEPFVANLYLLVKFEKTVVIPQ